MTQPINGIMKSRQRHIMRPFLASLLILSPFTPAAACLWDYDTLQAERAAFPGALELIVGKFLRHSDAFYEWRIEDRSAKIAAAQAGEISLSEKELAAAYDDWAVALDKLGRHDEAIEVINQKAERLPDVGEYKTHANRGTFLIHGGRLEEGLVELKKALEINPEAHFGREEYQVLLVEYVLEKRDGAEKVSLPLDDSGRNSLYQHGPFAKWLLEQQGLGESQDKAAIAAEIERAAKGVMGMMRFGNFQSPILLEALGDLLAGRRGDVQGQRLAARAYLRAAMEVDDDAARDAYREMAQEILRMQVSETTTGRLLHEAMTLKELEDHLARETKEANLWFESIVNDEKLWVQYPNAKLNPDERFWQKYGEQVIELGYARLPPRHFLEAGLPWQIQVTMAAIAVLTVALVVGLLLWRKKRPTGYDKFP